jgi:aerobic carbon-monoxide dehydrogenase small subunit
LKRSLKLTVNGEPQNVEIDVRARLVDVVRDTLQLTGTHLGCGTGNCGACTVILDGDTAKSCCTLAVDVDGATITTIEGIAPIGKLSPVQSAFSDCQGLQCGFCTPGMILSTMHLLKNNPNPDDEDIREAIAGNICRCTGYVNIVASIREAARRLMKDTTSDVEAFNATV